MIEQNYFAERQSSYEQETTKKVKSNIATRRLQVLPAQRGYTLGLPMSIVRLLNLHEQDLMKIQVTNDNIITMQKVDLGV
jgi:hypothetical protein